MRSKKMVSPWKRLARWISPGPAADQEDPSTNDLDLRVPALPQPADRGQARLALSEETEASQPNREQLAAANPDPSQSPEADRRSEGRGEVTGPAVSTDPVAGFSGGARTAAPEAAPEAAPPKRVDRAQGPRRTNRPAGKPDAVEIVSMGELPGSMHSRQLELDEEIRVLRSQLAEKLQQQNQQLKKMLERFL